MRIHTNHLTAGVLLALFLLAFPAPGWSSITDPVLAVLTASTETGFTTRLLSLDATLPTEDVLQISYPVQVLIQVSPPGTQYVRFDLSGGVFTGSAAELADGLDPADAASLLLQGASSPDGDVISVATDRLEMLLPASFPAGSAEVSLFVIHRGLPIVSNTVAISIGGATP